MIPPTLAKLPSAQPMAAGTRPSARGIRSFYGPFYLFQRSADQYIVVDTIQGMS
jgi:hypothetical protein